MPRHCDSPHGSCTEIITWSGGKATFSWADFLTHVGDDVNALVYWDQGHGANTDPNDFIRWIGKITGCLAVSRP